MIEVLAVRQQWCGPGEPLLWCLRSSLNCLFEVDGLDERGKPKKRWGARAALGLGDAAGGALGGVFDAVTGGNTDSDFKTPPSVVVFGDQPDCRAVVELSRVSTDAVRGCWVLTPERLAWLTFREPLAQSDESAGLLGGALKFGKGAVKFAREVKDIVVTKAEHEPGVAVPVPEVAAHLEIPLSSKTDISVHRRTLSREHRPRKPWYLRVRLSDGSGVDIGPSREEKSVQRLLAMSCGKI